MFTFFIGLAVGVAFTWAYYSPNPYAAKTRALFAAGLARLKSTEN